MLTVFYCILYIINVANKNSHFSIHLLKIKPLTSHCNLGFGLESKNVGMSVGCGVQDDMTGKCHWFLRFWEENVLCCILRSPSFFCIQNFSQHEHLT